MATRICIDVDLTIINENEELLSGVREGLDLLKNRGYLLILWSYGGSERAREIARKHKLCCFFEEYASKPDLAIDDEPEAIGRLPIVDAAGTPTSPRDWPAITRSAEQLAQDIDNPIDWSEVPASIRALGNNKYDPTVQCALTIWNQRHAFLRWPRRKRLLFPNLVKHPDGRNPQCYDYPPEFLAEITKAGLQADRRNNGPAILAFLLAGGDRPWRPFPETWSWTIHHIYDGKHGLNGRPVPHAIHDGNLFTEAAGLVAAHPLADYVAMNSPLLAWLLRWEAFRRFGLDPMGVFQEAALPA